MLDIRLRSFVAGMAASILLSFSGAIARSSADSTNSTHAKPAVASPAGPQLAGDVVGMTALEFEQWVAVSRTKINTAHATPVALEASLLKRLRSGRYVTDEAILAVIHASGDYESDRFIKNEVWDPEKGHKGHIKNYFPESARLVNELDSYTYGRPFLKAEFHQAKADFAAVNGDRENEKTEAEKATELLTPLQNDIAERRVRSIIQVASSQYALGD
ncbi:MAG: hypothetical protein M3Y56_08830, partial [Armatimonadota bacterium]|nr:hypothetical protein [Armatimonadota bacterium]